MPRARKTNSPPIFGPDIDPSSKASVEVEGRRVPSDTA